MLSSGNAMCVRSLLVSEGTYLCIQGPTPNLSLSRATRATSPSRRSVTEMIISDVTRASVNTSVVSVAFATTDAIN